MVNPPSYFLAIPTLLLVAEFKRKMLKVTVKCNVVNVHSGVPVNRRRGASRQKGQMNNEYYDDY